MCKTHSESTRQHYSKLELSVQSHRTILAKTTEKLASFWYELEFIHTLGGTINCTEFYIERI
jgi:hypothetical protein